MSKIGVEPRGSIRVTLQIAALAIGRDGFFLAHRIGEQRKSP